MIIYFKPSFLQRIVANENVVYSQIPFVAQDYMYYDIDVEGLLELKVEDKNISWDNRIQGVYHFYRYKDLETFKNLLLGNTLI